MHAHYITEIILQQPYTTTKIAQMAVREREVFVIIQHRSYVNIS